MISIFTWQMHSMVLQVRLRTFTSANHVICLIHVECLPCRIADPAVLGAISLESVNYPGQYVSLTTGAEAGRLGITSSPDVNDASFKVCVCCQLGYPVL